MSNSYDWDDAFANMAHVPGSESLPEQWAREAEAFRTSGVRLEAGTAYGDHERERYDLLLPDGEPVGIAVFVHGGYWMKLDRSHWSHLSSGALARGWAVCMPSYVLAPEAKISDITRQVARAIEAVSERVTGPIRLAGHSAGGHLVSRMVCADTPLSKNVLERIGHVLSISGVHDLRPLISTALNDVLQLDEAEARAESPALCRPLHGANLTCWVGGHERPEFIRQTVLQETVWRGFECHVSAVIDAHHNHFTVIDGLKDPDSPITKCFVGN